MDLKNLFEFQREMVASHARGDNETTARAMAGLLGELENQPIGVAQADQQLLGRLVLQFANIFVEPGFQVPETVGFLILQHNCLIANIFAGCLKSTTDPYLLLVKGDKQELYKTMVLYSARNETPVDIAKVFQANPSLVSQWLYQSWKLGLSAMCNKTVVEKLSRTLDEIHPRILPAADLHQLYFACTYLGNERERRIKEILNQSVQRNLKKPINNTPNPRKVAVFSDHFWKGHSVYRTLAHYIRALKESGLELTLIHAAPIPEGRQDTEIFSRVIQLPWNGSSLDIAAIESNDFGALIFPDVGMSLTSIFLANQRIAPVQMILTGHPSSTFGACIDYFISGKLVENPENAHLNYGERLVMLPSYGAVHEKPSYRLRGTPPRSAGELVINGSWSGQKLHWSFLNALNQVVDQAKLPVSFRIFSSVAPLRHKGASAFLSELSTQLPNSKNEVFSHLDYDSYMAKLEEADFALDCFPFSGSNTVSDMLHLGIPVLCREGTRWFNRIGPAMLRAIGLDELVATSDSQYIRKAVRLANDADYRSRLREQIAAANLDAKLYTPTGAAEFRQFIDEVLTNPKAYPGYEPIDLSGEPD